MWVIVLGFFVFCYVFARITCGRSNSKVCLNGKTAIVTGGNRGIGYQVALDLAMRGCRVIIADKDDATVSKEKIIKLTHNPNIVTKILDLASFKSIRAFVEEIQETEKELHILINNAGMAGSPQTKTEDGIQISCQVNYFGPFLLTYLLTDLLKKSKPSRIVFTSSIAAFISDLTVEQIKAQVPLYEDTFFSGIYAHSKLLTIVTANEFARRLRDAGVICNSLHPGGVKTEIFFTGYKQKPDVRILVLYLFGLIYSKSPEEGAQTTIHLATSDEVEGVTGKYFCDCKKFWVPFQVKNKSFCEEVWKLSKQLTRLSEEEIARLES